MQRANFWPGTHGILFSSALQPSLCSKILSTNNSKKRYIHKLFNRDFWLKDLMDWDFNPEELKKRKYVEVTQVSSNWWYCVDWILKIVAWAWLLHRLNGGSRPCSSSSLISSEDQVCQNTAYFNMFRAYFGCSLLPGFQLNSLWKLLSSVLIWSLPLLILAL